MLSPLWGLCQLASSLAEVIMIGLEMRKNGNLTVLYNSLNVLHLGLLPYLHLNMCFCNSGATLWGGYLATFGTQKIYPVSLLGKRKKKNLRSLRACSLMPFPL